MINADISEYLVFRAKELKDKSNFEVYAKRRKDIDDMLKIQMSIAKGLEVVPICTYINIEEDYNNGVLRNMLMIIEDPDGESYSLSVVKKDFSLDEIKSKCRFLAKQRKR